MRLVIQRVKSASVSVGETVIGQIDKGLFVLVGVTHSDTKEEVENLVEKLIKLRIMSDDNDKMNLSTKDVSASILVVSQFTLYADTSKGNRPSFIKAAEPKLAKEMYDYFIAKLMDYDIRIQTGKFGEYMKIDVVLDGPVTILLES